MNEHNSEAIPIILLIRCIDKYLILYNSQMHNMYFSLLFILKSYTSARFDPWRIITLVFICQVIV